MAEENTQRTLDHIDLTVGIVAAYISNNSLPPFELPSFITRVYVALAGLPASGVDLTEGKDTSEKATAGQIKKSITPEALISFIDGKPYKTLKRHLSVRGLDADTYRARYGLPADYPMVATSYSATRSAVAKNLGLGRKPTA